MILLILFAFLSGVVTIFAPCIWPLLPIILSVGVSGGERRPIGIVAGLVTSFTFFTLALSSLLRVVPIDPDTLRLFAVIVISLLGVTMVVPGIGIMLEAFVSRFSYLGGEILGKQSGFKGGLITGFALGIIWSPCAGPILATVATLAATQALSISTVLVTVAFVSGVGVPLFILTVLGQQVLRRTRIFAPYTTRIQQAFGVLTIFSALAIYTGYDQKLQVRFAEFCSANGITFLDRFQTNGIVTQALDSLRKETQESPFKVPDVPSKQMPVLENYGMAPEFTGIMNWLNIDRPLTLGELRGKVVLIDFWTYSCINCVRTLPYLTQWYERYQDKGLVIIGVHTPEFEFEKKTANVADALVRYGITYPVAQDNSYGTWQAYHNRYWPAHYLIDVSGNFRQYHFGEGGYEETERAIQLLLGEAGQEIEGDVTDNHSGDRLVPEPQTPETYLGSKRMERFSSSEQVIGTKQHFTLPKALLSDTFGFGGEWLVEQERAIAGEKARLQLRFQGKKVFLVMAPPATGLGTVQIVMDGKPLEKAISGIDVREGVVTVHEDRLYELIQGTSGEHTLELLVSPGVAVYAFTFS